MQIATNERHHAYIFAREYAKCHKHIMLSMENERLNEFIEQNVWEFSGVSHFAQQNDCLPQEHAQLNL